MKPFWSRREIDPKDVAFLSPGQPATVKISAYDYSIYGGLDATLTHISADTILDEEGRAYYQIRARTELMPISVPTKIPCLSPPA